MGIKGEQPKGSARIKKPEMVTRVSSDSLYPIFSFQYFDRDYYRGCNKDHKAALSDTIIQLSQLTWGALRQASHKGTGFETIPLAKIAGVRPAILTDDVILIHVFKYFGKCPMLGYKDGQIYYVIWLDNEMSRYNHGA